MHIFIQGCSLVLKEEHFYFPNLSVANPTYFIVVDGNKLLIALLSY